MRRSRDGTTLPTFVEGLSDAECSLAFAYWRLPVEVANQRRRSYADLRRGILQQCGSGVSLLDLERAAFAQLCCRYLTPNDALLEAAFPRAASDGLLSRVPGVIVFEAAMRDASSAESFQQEFYGLLFEHVVEAVPMVVTKLFQLFQQPGVGRLHGTPDAALARHSQRHWAAFLVWALYLAEEPISPSGQRRRREERRDYHMPKDLLSDLAGFKSWESCRKQMNRMRNGLIAAEEKLA